VEWSLWKSAVQVLDPHSIPIESDNGPSNSNLTNQVLSVTTAKEKATSKTTAGTFTRKRRQNSDTLSMQDSQQPLSHWHQLESHPENEIYFRIRVYTIVCFVCCLLSVLSVVVCMCLVLLLPAWLWVHGVRGKCCQCFSIVSCLFQWQLLSRLSSRLLCHLLSSRQERQFDLCVSGDGVGFWGVSCITAISRPDGSFVRGFVVWLS
jgi:hypothetical protein